MVDESVVNIFIIANSTFSWWGAWLSKKYKKIVVSPKPFGNWGHAGLIPSTWVEL